LASEDGPRDIFKGGGRSTSKPSKSKSPSAPKSKQPTPPGGGSRAPPTPPGGGKSDGKKISDDESTSKKSTDVSTGKTSRGLKKDTSVTKSTSSSKVDDRAKEIIARVTNPVVKVDTKKVTPKPVEPSNPFKKKKQQPPQRRNSARNRRNKQQAPAKRVRKLHRGKYMEFKYDVRKILEEESVEDEHRSNVLGQTWAKGERLGVSEAKEFLEEKVAAGIITETCANRIIKLIDSLTTRR
jgi:hypothetical protein